MKRIGIVLGLSALLVGCTRGKIERVEWPVMGTVAAVQVRGEGVAEIRQTVAQVFAEVEQLLNAHDPQSELSQLAAKSDAEILKFCNVRMRPCYEAAFALRDETELIFNPRWRGEGTMDLGAIAKGFAVDLAATALESVHPDSDILIDLGGNLKAVRGEWQVGVAGGSDMFVLKSGAACATSGTYYRGEHIKDGRTGKALKRSLHSVTVVHPSSAMLADGLSTVMYLLGRERGAAFLDDRYPQARVIWAASTL